MERSTPSLTIMFMSVYTTTVGLRDGLCQAAQPAADRAVSELGGGLLPARPLGRSEERRVGKEC